MSKKDKEVSVVEKRLKITTAKPYVIHEKRQTAFTDGELWAVAQRVADPLQVVLGNVEKDYVGYVRVEMFGKDIKVGMLHLKPDGTVWIRDAIRTFNNQFIFRMADSDIVEVGTWELELFEDVNEDNEYGVVRIATSGRVFPMMCKKVVKNGATRFALKPPYESDEIAKKFNADRAQREANVAAAREYVTVNVL